MRHELMSTDDRQTSDGIVQKLWKLDRSISYGLDYETDKFKGETCYIVSSSSEQARFRIYETYLFPADKDGNILDYHELPGSMKGTLNHEDTIARVASRH